MPPARSLLPHALGTAVIAVILDAQLSAPALSSAGYLIAVLLAAASSRRWHLHVTAASCLLIVAGSMLVPHPGPPAALWRDHALLALEVLAAWAFVHRARGDHAAECARLEAGIERLSAAIEFAGVSVWEWRADTRQLHAAGSSARRLGGRETLELAQYLQCFVHPEDAPRLSAEFDRLRDAPPGGPESFTAQYRHVRPDGAVRHIESSARARRGPSGRVERILGVSRDVTGELAATEELRKRTAELQEAQQRLARASLFSHEGHFEIDLLRKVCWCSSSFQALLGYAPEPGEAPYEDAERQIHPEDLPSARSTYRRHLEDDVPLDFSLRLLTREGAYRWFRIRGALERNAAGEPVRVAGSAQDVHQQKLAEDTLREVQARFARAVHGTQDGLWEVDFSSTERRLWFSPRMDTLLGYAEGELNELRLTLRELVHPEDRPSSDEAIFHQLRRGKPIDVEVRMRTRGGEYRWFRWRGSPGVDAEGHLIRASGSVQDVTEARAGREALIRASAAAEEASRAKSAFLATMSHEIRTPMNGIIGMTALLLDTVLGRVQREYADAIRASADSLLAIINDVLDFSKIEAGRLAIENLEMDLRACVEEVGTLMALQAGTKNLELIIDVHPEVPARVSGDAQRIRQCLVNLVGNATKFTTAGEVVLTVTAGASREGVSRVCFEVRDTGIGIAPEARPGLFQPFAQADSSTTRKFGGTGLGLSIVKRLVELMNGEVTFESTPGSGSVFRFTLPLQRLSAPASRTVEALPPGEGRRVLVVDDSETSGRLLLAQLEQWDFQPVHVTDGVQALERLRRAEGKRQPFELVLIDDRLGREDGVALGACIISDPEISRPRQVLLGSIDRSVEPGRLAAFGFSGYVLKPVRARELEACLRQVLAREGEEWSITTCPAGVPAVDSLRQPCYGARVLVVEDNAVNQKVAQRFLERLGCRVQLADHGAEAVRVCAAERFDVILMDMQMPVMDGLAATREIRRQESAGARVPIIALTANVLADHSRSCFEAGMDDVLTKPLRAERLREVLERFLTQRAAAASPPGAVQDFTLDLDSASATRWR